MAVTEPYEADGALSAAHTGPVDVPGLGPTARVLSDTAKDRFLLLIIGS